MNGKKSKRHPQETTTFMWWSHKGCHFYSINFPIFLFFIRPYTNEMFLSHLSISIRNCIESSPIFCFTYITVWSNKQLPASKGYLMTDDIEYFRRHILSYSAKILKSSSSSSATRRTTTKSSPSSRSSTANPHHTGRHCYSYILMITALN